MVIVDTRQREMERNDLIEFLRTKAVLFIITKTTVLSVQIVVNFLNLNSFSIKTKEEGALSTSGGLFGRGLLKRSFDFFFISPRIYFWYTFYRMNCERNKELRRRLFSAKGSIKSRRGWFLKKIHMNFTHD